MEAESTQCRSSRIRTSGRCLAIALNTALYWVKRGCRATLVRASALSRATSSLNQGALRSAKVAARSRTLLLGTKVPSRSGAWSTSAGSVRGMASHNRRACSVLISPPAHLVSTSPDSIVKASRADRFEHPVAKLDSTVEDNYHRLIDQPPHQVDYVARGAPDRLSRFQVPAAGKDREHAKQHLLFGLQQIVAPVDRAPDRLLPLRKIASPPGQQ